MSAVPIHTVSTFLKDLLTDHTLPGHVKDNVLMLNPIPTGQHFSIQLHTCTSMNLVPTIISIFNGVPEVFQVFQCNKQTSKDELDLFLQRASQHTFLHAILEVNKLSFQMQEVRIIKL